MFAGHVGAGLALARGDRRLNAAWFVAAALLLDIVLWALVLQGWESVVIPADFANRHQPDFVFPFSHGLVASVVWSLAFGTVLFVATRSAPAGAAAGIAVFSHWIFDAIVHRAELPLLGERSARFGFGLWDALPWALVLESAIVLVGTWIFLSDLGLSPRRRASLQLLVAFLLVSTIVGMTIAPPPPSPTAMAVSSLITLLLVCGLIAWIDAKRARA